MNHQNVMIWSRQDGAGNPPAGAALTSLQALAALGQVDPAPLDALADFAAAAGFEARGDRAAAEFYLGLGLAKMGHGVVAPAAVAGLLRLIATLARGDAGGAGRA